MVNKEPINKLSALAFVLCVPSGAALLAKVYGLAEMYLTVPIVVLPSCFGLVLVWAIAHRRRDAGLRTALQTGIVGGLLGLAAYDLYRVPFALFGHCVFTPIQVYGMWALNAHSSSSISDIVGAAYHVSNGFTFGLAYSVTCHLLGRRYWAMAILYALGLETVAVVTPFGRIFHLVGNSPALLIAYSGHLAYGLPLGWMTSRPQLCAELLASISAVSYRVFAGVCILLTTVYLFIGAATGNQTWSSQSERADLTVNCTGIEPKIIRLPHGGMFLLHNTMEHSAELRMQGEAQPFTIGRRESHYIVIKNPGIFQLRIASEVRLRSAFVITEPVSAVK